MVVESERAGETVQCPNCMRTLKVPSGKDRGVELASAPKVRTSRPCPHCQTEVPVDAQKCPNCKRSLAAGAAESNKVAAAISATSAIADAVRAANKAAISGEAGATEGGPAALRFGGHHTAGWKGSSESTKMKIIGIVAGSLLVIAAVIGLLYRSYVSGRLAQARAESSNAIDQGRKLEVQGKFQEAYDLYSIPDDILSYLKSSKDPGDVQLADDVSQRYNALTYLVHSPQIHLGFIPYWKPSSDAELSKERANLQANYASYQQMCLNIAAIARGASLDAQKDGNRPAYEAKIAQAMDAYVTLVNKSTPPQRATLTFQQLVAGVQAMTNAVRAWDKPTDRHRELVLADKYLEALQERLQMTNPFGDNFWLH
jgi:hypothetical protein